MNRWLICVTKSGFPHVGPVHAFATRPGSARGHATSQAIVGGTRGHALSAANGRFRCMISQIVSWARCNPSADNEDSSAGVCRLKAPVASPDRRRPAGTQVSTRTLSATLTSIADL